MGAVKKGKASGITPADAGKTPFFGQNLNTEQDHPRGCGENFYPQLLMPVTMGSPPRMRGKHDSETVLYRIGRITPADAGKTCATHDAISLLRDHPRGCGENVRTTPRVTLIDGITPADAGKT